MKKKEYNNIYIIKILILFYIFKNFKTIKTIFIIIFYKFLKLLFNIILKSINKINYENTIKGFIFSWLSKIHKKYYFKFKLILSYSFIIIINLISFFRKYIPNNVLIILGLNKKFNIWSLILTFVMLAYKIISDLIKIFGK